VNWTQEAWFPGFVTGSLSLVAVLGVAVLQTWRERKKAREDQRQATATPGAPTTQQVWERQDRQERVLRAAVGVIWEVSEQWEQPHPPVLSKRNVDVLKEEGYMPANWIPATTEEIPTQRSKS
jgi:hypothetical protein